MKCPFFKEDPQLRCMIHKEYLHIPRAFQLKEYCGNNQHLICPIFSKGRPGDGSSVHRAIDRE